MSRGAILFAHNNKEIDYLKIACINALMIQANLNIPVSLVTDEGTLEWASKDLGKSFISKCFDHIFDHTRDYNFNNGNSRTFKDTFYTRKKLPFYNANRHTAFTLSPYNETLLIDADYLIMSNSLSNCWNSSHDVMMSFQTQEASFNRPSLPIYVDEFGIRLYWATVVYFNKSKTAEQLFKTVEHVSKNYEFYKHLYTLPRTLYRNDFAFSISAHMLNGFRDSHAVSQLPSPTLLKSYDIDDIVKINDKNDITFLLEKPEAAGTYVLSRIKDIDIHVMNKWAILRHYNEFVETYS